MFRRTFVALLAAVSLAACAPTQSVERYDVIIANGTVYGLGGYVFAGKPEGARDVAAINFISPIL